MQADDGKDQAAEPAGSAAAKAPETSPANGGVVPAPAAPESSLIVLVDDDQELGKRLRSHFEEKGLRVETFVSRVDVLEWSWHEKPLLFVVDQDLSGEDGRSLALDLRDHGKLGDCPMVLITDSEMDLHNKEFTLKLGFRKIISKPFDFDALERVIADEPRAKAEALKAEAADKEVDQKAFEERKAAVLKKMGLDEAQAAGGEGAEGKRAGTPILGGPKTRKVQITTSLSGPKAKSAAVAVQAGAAPEEEAPGAAGHWLLGLALGFLFPAILVALRAFLYSAGYTTPLVVVEGAVLGVLLGLGFSMGLRRLGAPPNLGPLVIGTLFLTLAVWGLSVYLRHAKNIEFVEYSEAARAHLKDPGRTWGLSEWTALASNLAGGILTFGGAMYVIRSIYLRLEKAALSSRRD